MRVALCGNSLAIRLPSPVVEALGLHEGDEIVVRVAGAREFAVARDTRREDALERIRALAKPLPEGWVFDRDEANARRRRRRPFSTPTASSTPSLMTAAPNRLNFQAAAIRITSRTRG
jgi:antitoxin MazE